LRGPAGLRAVLFDLDGTLVDSLTVTFESIREVVRTRTGRTLADEEIYARFGPPDHEILAGFLPTGTEREAFQDLLRSYARHLPRIALFPGVPDLLDAAASRGLRLALTTGRGGESTRLILANLGLLGRFEAVVPGDGLPPKPAPAGIRRTLELLGERPGAAIFVGDTVKDVLAAKAAGVRSGAALWGSIEKEALRVSGADLVFESAGEARRLLTGGASVRGRTGPTRGGAGPQRDGTGP
jgi:phosphoglycolate phosphatase-like HAD superfamily hydrolase